MFMKSSKSLVINAGSSSVKFQVFDDKSEKMILSGLLEEIGGNSKIKLKDEKGNKSEETIAIPDHKYAFAEIINILKKQKLLEDISKVVHRTVHGGENFKEPTILNKKVVEDLKKLSSLAPLHNPPNIEGIEIMTDLLPKIPQIAIFDTSFHSTIPQEAFLYGLPYSYYKEKGIRKYGFHGSSHEYVIKEAISLLKNPKAKIISCHLGNGASVCAAIGGKSVDTSMGMTPLEGNIMGTRSGSIDPGIVLHLITELKMTPTEVNKLLNKESGMKGLSETTSDMRVIITEANKNEKAKRALDVYLYRLVQIIGSYLASIGGVDAIIFTGGVGENNPIVRMYVADKLKFLGVELDEKKNSKNELIISTKKSKVTFFVIPTNEELQMVRNAKKALGQK